MEKKTNRTLLIGLTGILFALILMVSGCSNPTASTPSGEDSSDTTQSEQDSGSSDDSTADSDTGEEESGEEESGEEESGEEESSEDESGEDHPELNYEAGDKGSADGYIFSVIDNETNEVIYLEAAPEDLRTDDDDSTFDWDLASSLASEYSSGDSESGDWRLPDGDELEAIYSELHENGLGGFVDDGDVTVYWGDRPGNSPNRRSLDFGGDSGESENIENTDGPFRARAIREIMLDDEA